MNRMIRMAAWAVLGCAVVGAAPALPAARAQGVGADAAEKLYERAAPSLVAVKYTWESELGRRELIGPGVVVSADGLVVVPMGVVDQRIPDEQMKEFRILVPSQEKDADELDAEFQGRDERTNLGFVKVKASAKSEDGDKKHKWTPLKFEDAPVRVGEPVLSVGLLPEDAAFKPYFMEGGVSATLRGEVPHVLVQGGLATAGSPVFNRDGKAIGMATDMGGTGRGGFTFLNDSGSNLAAITAPPKFFIPAADFIHSLERPPVAGKPLQLPWIGVPQLTGLTKDVAEVFGLAGQPAVQVGEVIPDTPADKGGLKQGDIIVKVNGKPLERGDQPDELPGILRRQILRMDVGAEVTLSVLRKRGQPPQDVKMTLTEQPARPNTAKRYYAEDLGFAVRDLTFFDTYARRLPTDTKGVTVDVIRPQSAAESGGLRAGDLITSLNAGPVTDVKQFQDAYKQARKDKPREAAVLVVKRRGSEDTVRIEPPQ